MAKGKIHKLYSQLGFLVAAIFIIWIMPRENGFEYEYQEGRPWKHENLIAPFDFPVLKTAEELQEDKQKAIQKKKLYFRKHDQAEQETYMQFEMAYHASSQYSDERKDKEILQKVRSAIKILYQKPIIEENAETAFLKSDDLVYLLTGNQMYEEHLVGEFISTQTAIKQLESLLDIRDSSAKKKCINLLAEHLIPSVQYDADFTMRMLEEQLQQIPLSKGVFKKEDIVIEKGDLVTHEKLQLLDSFKKEYALQKGELINRAGILLGQTIFVMSFLVFLYLFLLLFRKKILRNYRQTYSILSLIMLMSALTSLAYHYGAPSIYVVPFAILPILIRSFYDTRMALFAHIVTVMITAWFASNNYEFVIVEMGGGIMAIFSFINFRKRSQLYTTTFLVMIIFSTLYTALHLMREGSLLNIHYQTYLWFFVSCTGTLFSLPLIYIFEKGYGLFSELTLIELSDTNSRVLRELAVKAPGTFHHSIQVANLAEAAMDEIGGNSLLIRVGALHHDIGKTIEPQYFIENQVSGVNPHDGLSFEDSAEKIIAHVNQGVVLAEKFKLPTVIIDFIKTHHGTQTVQYFYKSYIKSYPNAEVDIKKFSYPGPLPFSKEMAVLMMADSVEAASRSIHEPTEEKITHLVHRIIDYQLQEKQFIHSDITLKDIDRVKKVFIRMLLNMYHVRIEYPQ